jgi:hypothetical protein
MGLQIEDGTGTGNSIKVDSENRMRVFSDQRSQLAFISTEKEQAYVISTGQLAVTVTNGLMLYFLNTSQTKRVHISNLFISWTGGATNHDRVVFGQLVTDLTTPTTNTTANTGNNLNSGSGNTADATILNWDGVGTGMTGGSAGTVVADLIKGRGFDPIPFTDALIVQFNDAIGINLQGEEAGTASVVMTLFFEDI